MSLFMGSSSCFVLALADASFCRRLTNGIIKVLAAKDWSKVNNQPGRLEKLPAFGGRSILLSNPNTVHRYLLSIALSTVEKPPDYPSAEFL
jgi:hypothetical protein